LFPDLSSSSGERKGEAMQILVTGGAGFIGRHLAAELLTCGHAVHILDLAGFRDSIDSRLPEGLDVEMGSVLDSDTVERAIQGKDVVIHLAGIAEPVWYCTHPKKVIDLTLQGSFNVIRACARFRVGVVFASTSEIYGYNSQVPWSEDADRVLGPTSTSRWCYGSAKAMVEHYLYACRQEEGLDFAITRFFNVYGPGLQGRVIAHFIQQALAGKPLTVHADGLQSRTFLYIDDAVAALRAIISKGGFSANAYNIGDTTPITILELAQMILNLTDSSSPLIFVGEEGLPEGFSDIPRRIPAIERIVEEFGWRPSTSLTAGLLKTIKAFRRDYPAKTTYEKNNQNLFELCPPR
jgi:UDP-glucose 4-epimerase